MKHRSVIALALLLAALWIVRPVQGQGGTIILNNADQSTTLGMTGDGSLLTAIQAAVVHPVVVAANEMVFFVILPPPPDLQTGLAGLTPRMVVAYANEWQTHALAYPVSFMNDTAPPVIGASAATANGLFSARVSWTTDEFSTSLLEVGTQPGSYPVTLADPFFSKNHEIVVTALTPGVRYYYRLSGVDRSGNLVQSSEVSFVFQSQVKVFLPLLRR